MNSDIVDSGEVLMLLYCSVVCFNSERAFDILLKRDNYFKQKPDWHKLFNSPKVYQTLKTLPISPERRNFDIITLKEAFDKDLNFMVYLVLERSRITREIIWTLLADDQKNMLVSLISKRPRPIFVDLNNNNSLVNTAKRRNEVNNV